MSGTLDWWQAAFTMCFPKCSSTSSATAGIRTLQVGVQSPTVFWITSVEVLGAAIDLMSVWQRSCVVQLQRNLVHVQVVLQFPEAFWETSVEFFGAALPPGEAASRGLCFMFWNLQPLTGQPILTALVSGQVRSHPCLEAVSRQL